MGLFDRKPNVEKMTKKGDIGGLIEALKYEEDADIRKAAAVALGKAGNLQAVDPLFQFVEGEDKYQENAVQAIGEIYTRIDDEAGKEEFINKTLLVLENNTGLSHRGALDILKRVLETPGAPQMEGVMQTLLQILDIKDTWPQGEAIKALQVAIKNQDATAFYVSIAKKVSAHEITKQAGLRRYALETLASIVEGIDNPEVLEACRTAFKYNLNDNRLEIRQVCTEGLGEVGTKEDLMALARRLEKDTQRGVQKAAAQAMAKIDQPKAVETLLSLIENFDRQKESTSMYKTNWFGATVVLGEIGEPWVIEPLMAILNDDDFLGSPSMQAAEVLGKMKVEASIEPLIQAMEKQGESMYKYAAGALRDITGQEIGDDPQAWRNWWKENK